MVNNDNSAGSTNEARKRVSGVGRRTFLKTTGAGAAGAALAGCLGDGGDGGEEVGDTISIGVLAPNPESDPIGASQANAAQIAATELNENGGIAGADVEIIVENTQGSPSTGQQRHRELVIDEGVDMTTGIFQSEVLMGVIDSMAEQETIHITAGAATTEASRLVNEQYDEYKYHFRSGPVNDFHLGSDLVRFADEYIGSIGWDSVAVLVEDFQWTEPISPILEEGLPDTDVEVVSNTRYASGTEDFTPLYDDAEDAGVDAVYAVMAHTGNEAIAQWSGQERPFGFGGIHVPMQIPAYWDLTDSACEYGVSFTSGLGTTDITERTMPFAEAYDAEYGTEPVYTGYHAYDAVMTFAEAVEALDGSVDQDDLVEQLEGQTTVGTAGPINFYGPDSEYAHDVQYGPMTEGGAEGQFPVYFQWQDTDGGSQQVLFPEEFSTTEYQQPDWI